MVTYVLSPAVSVYICFNRHITLIGVNLLVEVEVVEFMLYYIIGYVVLYYYYNYVTAKLQTIYINSQDTSPKYGYTELTNCMKHLLAILI